MKKPRKRTIGGGPLAKWEPSNGLGLRYLAFARVYLDSVDTLPPCDLAFRLLIQAGHWKWAACGQITSMASLQTFVEVENRIRETMHKKFSDLREALRQEQ